VNSINYNQTVFLKSFSNTTNIDIKNGIEIPFVGYSNSGKSSAINSLANHKKLARSSKTPGRTQLINFFEVVSNFRIVDLPGYGYSKFSILKKLKSQNILYNYLSKRKQIKGLVLLMDIRHPLKILDQKIINISVKRNIPILILLTKCDKLTTSQKNFQFKIVNKKLIQLLDTFQIEFFSSLKRIGIKKLELKLNFWYKKNIFFE